VPALRARAPIRIRIRIRVLTAASVLVLAATTGGCSIIPIPGLPFTTPNPVGPIVTSNASTVQLDFVIPEGMDAGAFMDSTLDFEIAADELLRSSDLGYLDGNEIGQAEYSLYFYGPDSTSMWELIEPLTDEFKVRPTRAYLSDSEVQEPMLVTLD
jgi:hypothetical protein